MVDFLNKQENDEVDEFNKQTTQAYDSQKELDEMLSNGDMSLFRNHQFSKADVVNIKTIYEEIFVLWDEKAQFRQGFKVDTDIVHLPVIFANICGSNYEKDKQYWKNVESLIVGRTYVCSNTNISNTYSHGKNKIKNKLLAKFNSWFNKDGTLNREKLMQDKKYKNKYKYLREDIQDHLLDKLDLMLTQNIFKTDDKEFGYTIISTFLNLNNNIVTLIKNFDFTKEIPKIIYIKTVKIEPNIIDSIVLYFLHLLCFDIILFTPNGNINIEMFYEVDIITEHHIGNYKNNLSVPAKIRSNLEANKKETTFLGRIFSIFKK